ncbi:MAG TPA: hypothetical protein VF453_14775 [Burkholderiaceae bacterium]
MRIRLAVRGLLIGALCLAVPRLAADAAPRALAASNEAIFEDLRDIQGLDERQLAAIRAIFARSPFIGQGNPAVTVHPSTPAQCREARARAGLADDDPRFERVCGAKHMAPLYDPARERPEDAKACIDQYEFPDVPCDYPVVWVRAREAAEICQAEGRRLCDAHEWEGACEGRLAPPDYRFDLARGRPDEAAVDAMRSAHNRAESAHRTWPYGPAERSGVCGTGGRKTPSCNGGSWAGCGSNTYPAGAFPGCRSALDVFDLEGNAAEHMNLPLDPTQMAGAGSRTLGVTEMKGSWFVFDTYHAHEDWCRWRAPFWHGSRVMDPRSHANYHLGFRCCKSL